jgi:hypothetical protein
MKYIGLTLIIVLFTACTVDNYDTGDGKYSYMRADFVMAHTSAAGEVNYAVTDDGDSLVLNPHATAKWATTGDSIYRGLLYYNKVETKTEPLSLSWVPVLRYRRTADIDTIHTDPVVFESAWLSSNRKFLNIGFSIKTGKQEGQDNKQTIGMMCDTVKTNADGTHDIYLRFSHNQNGVPQYYSSRMFASVPLNSVSFGYTIHLSINTFDGIVNKDFAY